MERTSSQTIIENAKQAGIKKLIHCYFPLDENYSIFHPSNAHNHAEINKVFERLVSPYGSAIELIQDVQFLSEITFYSFKRIYLPKGDSEILFCCSSISPKKLRSESERATASANSASSGCNSAIRNLKRENCDSCPMRLKFKFDSSSGKYQVSEDSNFNHNHSSISDSSENYHKKSQNIKFQAKWILEMFSGLYALQGNKKSSDDLEKSLCEIRHNLISNNNILFSDSTHKTNFCKKLIYLIKKMNRVMSRTAKDSTFEEKFFSVFKYLLRRGANYLKQENLHLLNNMIKSASGSCYNFFANFRKDFS